MGKKSKMAFGVEPAERKFRLRLARYQGLAEAIADYVRSTPPAPRERLQLLDIGVGNGRTFRYCEAAGVSDQIAFYGLDNSPRRLSSVYGGDRWKLSLADVQEPLPFPAGRFDLVVCEQLLEHVSDPKRVLAEMSRVLVPGGMAIMGVPIFPAPLAYLRRTLVPRLDRLVGRKSDHLQAFSLKTFRRLVESAPELSVREARGFRVLSGGPLRFLEDYAWWYRFNRAAGRMLPRYCIEVQLLATKAKTAAVEEAVPVPVGKVAAA
jgi:SAM-dependent methyltransferase